MVIKSAFIVTAEEIPTTTVLTCICILKWYSFYNWTFLCLHSYDDLFSLF